LEPPYLGFETVPPGDDGAQLAHDVIQEVVDRLAVVTAESRARELDAADVFWRQQEAILRPDYQPAASVA
jgi:hypothetical protein